MIPGKKFHTKPEKKVLRCDKSHAPDYIIKTNFFLYNKTEKHFVENNTTRRSVL